MVDKQVEQTVRRHSPDPTGIKIIVCKRASCFNSNHFYNQVLMRMFASFPRIYIYPRLRHFKNEGGPSAGSSFEQISMQRLTGVPSPISGGTGRVGSGWDGICKGQGQNNKIGRRVSQNSSTHYLCKGKKEP